MATTPPFAPGDPAQFATINTRDWYTAMRTAAFDAIGALSQVGVEPRDENSWLKTLVGGVYVEFAINDSSDLVKLRVGQNADLTPMFEWDVPIGWVTT